MAVPAMGRVNSLCGEWMGHVGSLILGRPTDHIAANKRKDKQ